MWKQYFQMQFFDVVFTFYSHYATFLTTTFKVYNNIQKLQHCLHFMKSFKISNLQINKKNKSNKSIVYLRFVWKKISRVPVYSGQFVKSDQSYQ